MALAGRNQDYSTILTPISGVIPSAQNNIALPIYLNGKDNSGVFDSLSPLLSSDPFSGNDGEAPSPSLWKMEGTTSNTFLNNNKLRTTSGGAIVSGLGITGKFYLNGDLDVRVNMDVIAGPATTQWSATITLYTETAGIYAFCSRRYNGGQQVVTGIYNVSAYADNDTVSTSITSTIFRFVRTGSTMTCYYWNGTSWVSMSTWSSFPTGKVYPFFRIYTSVAMTATFDWYNFEVIYGKTEWDGTQWTKLALEIGDTGIQSSLEKVRWDAGIQPKYAWDCSAISGGNLIPWVGGITGTVLNRSIAAGGPFGYYLNAADVTSLIRYVDVTAVYFKTISIWIKRGSIGIGTHIMMGTAGQLMYISATNELYFYNGSSAWTDSTFDITDTDWHNIILVQGSDTNHHYVWLDGVRSSSEIYTYFGSALRYIGRSTVSSGNEVPATTNVQLFPYKLSDAEIAKIVASGSTGEIYLSSKAQVIFAPTELTRESSFRLYYDPASDDNDFITDIADCVDDFSGPEGYSPNEALWEDTLYTLTGSNEAISPVANASLNSKFYLSGDCTVIIDFEKLAGTEANGYYIHLALKIDANNYFVVRLVNGGTKMWQAYKCIAGAFTYYGTTAASVNIGRLRIIRSGTSFSAAYDPNTGTFVTITTQTIASDDVYIQLAQSMWTGVADLQSKFYNLSITGTLAADLPSFIGDIGSVVGERVYKDTGLNIAAYPSLNTSNVAQYLDSTGNGYDATLEGIDSTNLVSLTNNRVFALNATDERLTFGSTLGMTAFPITIDNIVFKTGDLTAYEQILASTSAYYYGIMIAIDVSSNLQISVCNGLAADITARRTYYIGGTVTANTEYTLSIVLTDMYTISAKLNGEDVTVTYAGGEATSVDFSGALYAIGYRIDTYFRANIGQMLLSSGARSSDYLDVVQAAAQGLLWVYDYQPSVVSMLTQPFSIGYEPATQYLKQVYSAFDTFVQKYLTQPYAILVFSQLVQRYGDAPYVMALLYQWWKQGPYVRSSLPQSYSLAEFIMSILAQTYKSDETVRSQLQQLFSMFGEPVMRALTQKSDMLDYDEVLAMLKQRYAMLTNNSEPILPIAGVVTINDKIVMVKGYDLEHSVDSYAVYIKLYVEEDIVLNTNIMDSVTLTVFDTTYRVVALGLPDDVQHESSNFFVTCRSRAALLDTPYQAVLETDEDVYGTASEICNRILAHYGETIVWDMTVNPTQSATTYSVQGKTPLGAVRDLVNELGGKLYSEPSGQLHAVEYYKDNTDKFAAVTQDKEYSMSTVSVLSTDPDKRDGYNYFVVSNDTVGTEYDLKETKVSGVHKKYKAYKVPWISTPVSLSTSKLHDVSITANGIETEQITEVVEIKNGEGQTDLPVYGLVSAEYDDTVSLGDVTFSESGIITTTQAKETLLTLTYVTKYWSWDCFNYTGSKVQFILD